MKYRTEHFAFSGTALPHLRQIGMDRPLAWLKAGWQDIKANPLPSLAYGLLFALCGDLIILALIEYPHLLTVAISGFFFVAPLLAAGLYELSRHNAAGESILFIDSLKCFGRNGQSLAFFGLILALVGLFWERLSAVAFALVGATSAPVASAYLNEIVFNGDHLLFTVTWFALGGVLALFVYALSVVSVPLMLDRDSDVATAIMTSLRAFTRNVGPLLLWAALLVAMTLLGFATLLFGLILIMPILGHASWHAYRELVE